jgi:serine/threonine-protein kinase
MIEFIRRKDYEYKGELGEGACGKTVLLYDNMLDQNFVCKKYQPNEEQRLEELYNNFINEAKLLFSLNHKNIVKIYNCFLYPDQYIGYILMEQITGDDIETYLEFEPERINDIFKQIINTFTYLEEMRVLHRDIRPNNILVDKNDNLKVIDFGFSKKIVEQEDYNKSISLNWWCEPPSDFSDNIYNFSTEVYFIGKIFEHIINENEITNFSYETVLGEMCKKDPGKRISNFYEVKKELNKQKTIEINFTSHEIDIYRNFSEKLSTILSNIEKKAKYENNVYDIIRKLEDLYRRCMLEEYIPDNKDITRAFISGTYYYNKAPFPTYLLYNFLTLLKGSPNEKRNIILTNLQTKLDSIKRYDEEEIEDDIPF